MRRFRRRTIFIVAGITAAIYIGVSIYAFTNLRFPRLGILSFLFLLLAAVAELGGKWMLGMQFRHGVVEVGSHLSTKSAFRAALVGAGVARLIPAGGAITPVAMAWTVRREAPGTGGAAVRSTVLHFSGLLIATGIALLWVINRGLYSSLAAGTAILAVILILTGSVLFFGTGWLGSVSKRLPPRIRDLLGHTAANHAPDLPSQGWLWGRVALESAAVYLVMQAMGIPLTPSQVISAFGISQLAGGLPGTPGGIGFAEAGLVGALAAYGYPAAFTVAPILIYRIVSYWLPAVGGLVAGGTAFLREGTRS